MTTVVVTGANGFLGRHVCRAAARAGHEVVGIGHGDWTEEEWRRWGLSFWNELDVTLATLASHVGRPDAIVHCAGSSSVGFSFENPAQDFDRTVQTTLEVLEYLRVSSPDTTFVYPSSAAVYGRAGSLPIPEDSPLEPISPYGVHKKIAEDLCRSYAGNFGLRVAIVRIFSAYGVGLHKQLLWDACRKAMAGDRSFAGTGRETRDWVNAEDVARLLLVAADHATPDAPVVNGASGSEVAVRDILGVLFETLGRGGRVTFTGSVRSGDPERYAGDPSRANAWGWTPSRSWQGGVREYAEWFRETIA
jgi:UDP-glucose 4-epimerase